MKGFKNLVAVIMSLAMVVTVLMLPVKAEAAGAQRFNVVYDASNARWAYQIDGGAWYGGIEDIEKEFKDGDILAVIAPDGVVPPAVVIKTNARIAELGASSANATVYAKGVDLVYATNDSTLIVNSDVKVATCYAGSILQINGNCEDFTAEYRDETGKYPVFAVQGTVTKATVKSTESVYKPTTIYSIPEKKFVSSSIGGVWIEKTDYKTTAPATTNTNKNDKNELDDVPKTGMGLVGSVVFFILSAGCAALGAVFKKRESLR